VKVAKHNAMSITMEGSAIKENMAAIFPCKGNTNGRRVVIANNATGRSEAKKLVAVDGSLSSGNSFGWNVTRGLASRFFNVLANTGPARMIAGMATIIPYNKVSPILH
jgi:hypothetical protein